MKRWLVAAAIAVAGCQTATTATVSEQLSPQDCYGVGNYCREKFPPSASWIPGDPFPQSTPDTVVMFMRESPAVWQVFGADPVLGEVIWRRSMKANAVGAFMNLVADGTQAYGGVRPPPVGTCPPICIEPPAMVLAAALRMQEIQSQAEADAAACPLK